MAREKAVLIGGASIYNKSYHLNSIYQDLPKDVQAEIQQICQYYAEKLHCFFGMKFDEDGTVVFVTAIEKGDYNYDEIGAKLEIDKLMKEKSELLNAMKIWYKVYMTEEGKALVRKITKGE